MSEAVSEASAKMLTNDAIAKVTPNNLELLIQSQEVKILISRNQ